MAEIDLIDQVAFFVIDKMGREGFWEVAKDVGWDARKVVDSFLAEYPADNTDPRITELRDRLEAGRYSDYINAKLGLN